MRSIYLISLVFVLQGASAETKEDCLQVCVNTLNNCTAGTSCGFDYTKCENACTKKYGLGIFERPYGSGSSFIAQPSQRVVAVDRNAAAVPIP
jgi:hypothetical protein